MVVPFFFSSNIRSINRFCIKGSRPLVGSSRITISGFPIKAFMIPSFCFIPFDIFRTLPEGSSSSRSINSFIRLLSRMPFISARKFKSPRPVKSSGKAISPARYPRFFWMREAWLKQSIPLILHSPFSGFRKPSRCLIVVVFPAPLGPRKPYTSPFLRIRRRQKFLWNYHSLL